MLAIRTALLLLIVLAMIHPAALADDGYISAGGNPHLMSAKTHVSMQSEVVRVNIQENLVTADCNFIFKNNGPECTVRMGFPDNSTSNPLPRQEPTASFRSYESFLDGIPVRTETVWGKIGTQDIIWHAKEVHFADNSTRQVRDVYTDIASGAQIGRGVGACVFIYMLQTAASWSGNIEDADLFITFEQLPVPLKPISVESLPGQNPLKFKWQQAPAGSIVYSGPCAPEVIGRTMHFHVKDLHPTEKSDISLMYGFQKVKQQ